MRGEFDETFSDWRLTGATVALHVLLVWVKIAPRSSCSARQMAPCSSVASAIGYSLSSVCKHQHVPTVVDRPVLGLAQKTLAEQPRIVVADRTVNVAHNECADLQ